MTEIWVLPSKYIRGGRRLTNQQVSCDIKSFQDQGRKQLALPQELRRDPTTEASYGHGLERGFFFFQLEKEWGEHSNITNGIGKSLKARENIPIPEH